MQITLNQVEIEAALKAYILNQININDGMEIVIDLKATRGEAGTTAIIDIVPRTEQKAEVVKPAASRTVTAQAKEVVKEKPAAVATTSMAQVVEEAQASEPEEPETSAEEAGQEAAAQAEAESADAEEAEEAAPAVASARPSLFAGLNRPKNS
ncbi:hypothetical protein HYP85_gp069 [Pseudomonas phage Zuri]|uniref:Holliday junction resolvase n=1 Tax=Pseudomonas phage Zuri TaxID=2604899 RepID=A0A5C1K6Y6_9CAUD|nr:hypothetical protein HYP85_gp069 [Pseudomonas phage Zuri]QEM41166.1 Holliday junction resolvase [Pseudomonas phage Zuri]